MGKLKDLTGQRFGRLVVVKRGISTGENKGKNAYWLCRCDCGEERNIRGSDLLHGDQQSCGCQAAELMSKAKTIDLSGQQFGELTCIEKVGKSKSGSSLWLCKCSCGEIATVSQGNLASGSTVSCGCHRTARTKELNTKHGLSRTRTYRIWRGMKKRCLLLSDKAYPGYGGRGIAICKEWLDFPVFHKWAVSNGYADNLTIERKNNDGNYEPANCEWIPLAAQARNRRNSREGTR